MIEAAMKRKYRVCFIAKPVDIVNITPFFIFNDFFAPVQRMSYFSPSLCKKTNSRHLIELLEYRLLESRYMFFGTLPRV